MLFAEGIEAQCSNCQTIVKNTNAEKYNFWLQCEGKL